MLVLAVAPAGAEPAREATFDETNTTFEWSDGPHLVTTGTEFAQLREMCDDPGFPCDDTLIHVAVPGKLRLTVTATEDLPGGQNYRPDVDIYLHRSDAAGAVGSQVSAGETPNATEVITVTKAQPGYYLLRVAYFSGLNVSSTGKATFTPAPPVVVE